MAAELSFRPGTPTDTPRILDLVRRSLGEGKIPRTAEYWRWKHRDNPFGQSPCLLAEADGQLVGLRVFMRWAWQAGGATFRAVRAVDTATHPDWRGQGIFSRLTLALVERMRADGVAFVFNTPNDQSRPGYLKMGWTLVGRTSVWVRPLRPLNLLSASLPGRVRPSSPHGGLDSMPIGSPVLGLVQHPYFARLLDDFPVPQDRFSTPRSSGYLRWRYAEIPGFEYRAHWLLEGCDGAAAIFRLKNRKALRELRLCELFVGKTGKSKRMGRQLLGDLCRKVEADYATAMAGLGRDAHGLLLRSGFLPAPRLGPVMTVRPLNPVTDGLNPLRLRGWNLSIGDLELF